MNVYSDLPTNYLELLHLSTCWWAVVDDPTIQHWLDTALDVVA